MGNGKGQAIDEGPCHFIKNTSQSGCCAAALLRVRWLQAFTVQALKRADEAKTACPCTARRKMLYTPWAIRHIAGSRFQSSERITRALGLYALVRSTSQN